MDPITPADFRRIEEKVDRLTDAVQRLILIEERQTTQGERIGKCEAAIAVNEAAVQRVDFKVERWINRGIGAWAVAGVLFALVQYGSKWFGGN